MDRIDELAELYDRPLLITQNVYNVMSEKAAEFCRRIDLITMKEALGEPIEIYSFDVYPSEAINEDEIEFDHH